jgi:hypothetical protein
MNKFHFSKSRRLAALLLASSAAALVVVAIVFAATTTLVVTPGNMQGWQIRNTAGNQPTPTSTPAVTFVNGPATPPLNSGSVQLSVGSDGSATAQLRHPSYASVSIPTPTPTPDPNLGEITYAAGTNELSALIYSTSGGHGKRSAVHHFER